MDGEDGGQQKGVRGWWFGVDEFRSGETGGRNNGLVVSGLLCWRRESDDEVEREEGMKRHIFIMMLFALCLTSFQAHAQRYLPGMKGLQVTAGMADGVHWNSDTDFAYHIYTDQELYEAFNLPQKYIDIIESVIKERK